MLPQQPTGKNVELLCLLVEVAGGVDETGEIGAGYVSEMGGCPKGVSFPARNTSHGSACVAGGSPTPLSHSVERVRQQTNECAFDVRPCRVLGEDCTDTDLEPILLGHPLWTRCSFDIVHRTCGTQRIIRNLSIHRPPSLWPKLAQEHAVLVHRVKRNSRHTCHTVSVPHE